MNPFSYIRSEKGILKLVTTLIANTKNGEKSGGDRFWEKSETLLYTALIAYLHYEAPPHKVAEDYERTKAKKKAAMDAKKNTLRAEDISKGVFVPVSHLPKSEPVIADRVG